MDDKHIATIDSMLGWARAGMSTGGIITQHTLETFSDEIETLRAEVERLNKELTTRKGMSLISSGICLEKTLDRAEKAEADNKRLREALGPIANIGRMVPELGRSYGEILHGWIIKSGDYEITKSMFTDAAKALKDTA